MELTLEELAREGVKQGLEMLHESHHKFFKRMYSPANMDADINDIVDNMSVAELNSAMAQVTRTLESGSTTH